MLLNGSWARFPRSRGDLTGLQQEILIESFESVSLTELLNWCTPPEDGPYWNRKWKYVPEISASSISLLNFGLIQVFYDGRALNLSKARAVLRDFSNWWVFDAQDKSDPVEWSKLVDAGVKPPGDQPEYRLGGTDRGRLPWPEDEQRSFLL